MATPNKYRVMIGPAGPYGPVRGKNPLEAPLRDAGFEVLYTDLAGYVRDYEADVALVSAAHQEKVDAICVSTVVYLDSRVSQILELLKEKGLNDVLLFGGGLIDAKKAEWLSAQGAGRIFLLGTKMDDVVTYLREELARRGKT
jgi:methylmalonyl-CoA mutase C-terminal domain/subunit